MLSIIEDLPNTVVGVKATGQVSKDDYENLLMPALRELYKRTGKVNLLIELDTELHNFTTGAWIEDFKAGITYFTKWHRVAIVSKSKGVEWFTDIFGLIVPGDYKGFPMDELDKAKAWVAG